MDLDSGEPIIVNEGKGEFTLEPFQQLLGRRKRKIQAIAIDMGPAYAKAVRENFPGALVIYDSFHVVKLMNERIDDLRRSLCRKETKDEMSTLKGVRHLLLKNRDNLDVMLD
jgi:transposase